MFINFFFNYRGERTQGECVVRANGPDTSQNWLLQGTLTDTDHTQSQGERIWSKTNKIRSSVLQE